MCAVVNVLSLKALYNKYSYNYVIIRYSANVSQLALVPPAHYNVIACTDSQRAQATWFIVRSGVCILIHLLSSRALSITRSLRR